MSKHKVLVDLVRGLKPGKSFVVESPNDRTLVLNVARVLRNAGAIDFRISTRASPGGGFMVFTFGK